MSGAWQGGDDEWSHVIPNYEQVIQRYPNDWRAQHAWADLAKDGKEAVARYDKIIARFPDKAALYAGRVIRYAQIVSYSRPEEFWLTGQQPSGELKKADPSDSERAIVAVREAMKVEPDNAFYNYAMASYLFGLHRDDEALAQMAEGARKPRYDSHAHDSALSRIHVDKLAHGTPVSRIAAMSAVLLPHCARERSVARLVVWYGKQAEQKGKHALALERFSHVMRMGEHLIVGSHMLIEALVGVAIEAVGSSRGIKSDKRTRWLNREEMKKWQERQNQQRAQHFADYAAAHGRKDLASAAWASLERARMVKEDWWGYLGGANRERFRNVEEPHAALTRYLRIIVGQSSLAIQAGLALLMAGITALLAWKFREKQQVSWLTAFCVAIVCWLPAAVLLYSNCKRAPNILSMQSAEGPFSPLLLFVSIALPFVLEDICWGARMVWMRLRPKGAWRFDSPPLLPRTCVMIALLSLFTYAALLVPLKRAEREANAYTERVAAGEVQIAREILAKMGK
jgi:hypothetical protein